jgi:hypothetical protein
VGDEFNLCPTLCKRDRRKDKERLIPPDGNTRITNENANPVSGIGVLISGPGKTHSGGHLIPRPAFQLPACFFLLASAPFSIA